MGHPLVERVRVGRGGSGAEDFVKGEDTNGPSSTFFFFISNKSNCSRKIGLL